MGVALLSSFFRSRRFEKGGLASDSHNMTAVYASTVHLRTGWWPGALPTPYFVDGLADHHFMWLYGVGFFDVGGVTFALRLQGVSALVAGFQLS